MFDVDFLPRQEQVPIDQVAVEFGTIDAGESRLAAHLETKLAPLYLIHGDEPLLALEAADDGMLDARLEVDHVQRARALAPEAPRELERVVAEVGVTISKTNKHVRVNTMMSAIVKTSRHMSASPRIELKRNFFTTFEFVMTLDLRVGVDDVGILNGDMRIAQVGDLRAAGFGQVRANFLRQGRHFIAITDPGSGLQKIANELKFRKTFLNDPNIGGRYSALSFVGIPPAAFQGVDLDTLLARLSVDPA